MATKNMRRVLSLLMTLVMVLGMLPVTAMAEEMADPVPPEGTIVYVYLKVTNPPAGTVLNGSGFYTIGTIKLPIEAPTDGAEILKRADVQANLNAALAQIDRTGAEASRKNSVINIATAAWTQLKGVPTGANDYVGYNECTWHLDGTIDASVIPSYTVTFLPGDHGAFEAVTQTQLVNQDPLPPRATPGEPGWKFNGWSPALTPVSGDAEYTALWKKTEYTVTWKDEDGKILRQDEVEHGDMPDYGSIPTKAADAQYTYTFNGWTPEVVAVTGDTEYTATYTKATNAYKVTYEYNGEVPAGATALPAEVFYQVGDTVVVAPAATAPGYTFNGWSKQASFEMPANDVEISGSFTAVTPETTYTVTYTDGVAGEDVFADQTTGNLKSGDATPGFTGSLVREGYTFAGWTPAVAATVTGDVTYTANWTPVTPEPTYTVAYVDGLGNTLQSTDGLEAGMLTPVFAGTPTREGYTFAGWTPAVSATVTGNAIYAATWTENAPETYTLTVRYVYANGEEAYATYTAELEEGQEYSVSSPVLGRYTPSMARVSGVMGDSDYTVTVIYTYDRDDTDDNRPIIPERPQPPIRPNLPDPTPDPDEIEIIDEETPLAGLEGLNMVDHYAYIIGDENGLVRPSANITRAEVATIFFRLMTDIYRDINWATENDFSDVEMKNWFNNAVSTSANAGVINGYPGGAFAPNKYITRAEFAAIAARFLSEEYVGIDLFSDISGHWAAEEINRAANAGWITGDGDGTFRPDDYITRAEAMKLVNTMLGRKPEANNLLDGMKTWEDNMDTSKWYYAHVQEATNSHDYECKEEDLFEIWTALQEERDWAALEKEWADSHSAPGEEVMD